MFIIWFTNKNMTVREKLENGDTQNSSPIILTKDSVMTLG